MSVEIVAVETADLNALKAIARETFHTAFKGENDPKNLNAYMDKAFSTTTLRRAIKSSDSHYVFAKIDSEIAGYARVNFRAAQTEPVDDAVELHRIYMREKYKGYGGGKALMDYALSEARAAKVRWLWLGVWEKNTPAIAFYKSRGFTVFDAHTFYMGDVPQHDFLMRRAVN